MISIKIRLNNAKGMEESQSILWLSDCLVKGHFRAKNTFLYSTYYLVVASGNTVYYLHDDKVIWKCEFDNYLFGLSKLDVNDDGTDEVVVVSSTTGQVCMYVQMYVLVSLSVCYGTV